MLIHPTHACSRLCAGSFSGGDLEPGTFHGPDRVDAYVDERIDINTADDAVITTQI